MHSCVCMFERERLQYRLTHGHRCVFVCVPEPSTGERVYTGVASKYVCERMHRCVCYLRFCSRDLSSSSRSLSWIWFLYSSSSTTFSAAPERLRSPRSSSTTPECGASANVPTEARGNAKVGRGRYRGRGECEGVRRHTDKHDHVWCTSGTRRYSCFSTGKQSQSWL